MRFPEKNHSHTLIIIPFLILAFSSTAAGREPDQSEARFQEAVSLERAGKFEEALAPLEEVCAGDPDHPLADDACFKLGTICDRRLHNYGRAVRYYEALAERFPSSRHAPWVKRRLSDLARNRSAGDEPLVRYERVLAEYARRDKGELIAEMEGIIEAFPAFPLIGKIHIWLGEELGRLERWEEAETHYRRAVEVAPEGDEVLLAQKAIGNLHYDRGEFSIARTYYAALENSGDPTWRRTGEQLVERMEDHIARRRIARGLAVFLAASILLLVVRISWRSVTLKELISLRWELGALGVVGALLFILTEGKPGFVRVAVLTMTAATAGLVALSALRLNSVGPVGWMRRSYPVWIALLVGSMIYLTFHHYDLIFILEDTIRFGPE